MAAERSLTAIYSEALDSYENLYNEGGISDSQLAMLKGHTGLSDVLNTIKETKMANEEQRNAFDRLFHRISPEVVAKIQRFAGIVETAIQADPGVASLVWGSIRFIVSILGEVLDSHIKICNLLEEISLCLERYYACVELLGVTQLLKGRLISFYDDVLLFGIEVGKFYGRSRTRTIGASLWKSLEEPFNNIEVKLHKHAAEIELALVVEHIKVTVKGFDRIGNGANSEPITQTKLYVVPDLLTRWFTGRASQLDNLRALTTKSTSKRVAIYGMPGVGKSQLILQFAALYKKSYPESNVIFVDATKKQSLFQDFNKIHRILLLPPDTQQDTIIENVKQWLVKHEGWLLLVDNVASPDVVRPFLPAGDSGIILFTTRSETCARSLGSAGKMQLLPLNDEDSVGLILKAAEIDPKTVSADICRDAEELGRLLGGLPLALEQSIACVVDRRWTLSTYLEQLRTARIETLNQGPGPTSSHSNVSDTFNLAISQLPQSSIALLKLMAHLDHHSIPIRLLNFGSKHNVTKRDDFLGTGGPFARVETSSVSTVDRPTRFKGLKKLVDDLRLNKTSPASTDRSNVAASPRDVELREAFRLLFSNSNELEKAISGIHAAALISRKQEGSIWIHDLVCDLSLGSVDPKEQSLFADIAVTLCYLAFPSHPDNHELWEDCEEIVPHAVASLAYASKRKLVPMNAALLQLPLGIYYGSRGRYHDAMEFFESATASFEKNLGEHDARTLFAITSMANVLDDQGRYKDSLEWHGRVLAVREKVLGPEHPDVLRTVNNMAASFRKLGEQEKALDWYRRAVIGFERSLGASHPDTLSAVTNLANVLDERGVYEEALQWHQRALAGREKALGSRHPQTLSTANNMACSLRNQGKYKEAMYRLDGALVGFQGAVGPSHPHTLSAINNIGNVFYDQGKHEEALRCYKVALEGREQVLGTDHVDTLSVVNNIANALSIQGRCEESFQLHERALAGRKNILGPSHLMMLNSTNNMAVTFSIQGLQNQALQWFEKAFHGFQHTVGSQHPDTLTASNNIATVLEKQGNFKEAQRLYEEVLAGREKVLGLEHPDTLTTIAGMANVLEKQGEYEGALQWYERALNGCESTLGLEHPFSFNIAGTVATLFNKQKEKIKAITWYETQKDFPGWEKRFDCSYPKALQTQRLLTWCGN